VIIRKGCLSPFFSKKGLRTPKNFEKGVFMILFDRFARTKRLPLKREVAHSTNFTRLPCVKGAVAKRSDSD